MKRSTWMAVSFALAGVGAQPALAADPVIVPTTGKYASANPPIDNADINWPGGYTPYGPFGVALNPAGTVRFLGDTQVKAPVVWDDVGSGPPLFRIGVSTFPKSGVYHYACTCTGGQEGKVFVVGPRAILKPKLNQPDNVAPVQYILDGTGSFTTDFTSHPIVRYEFDVDNDGTFEQSGPEATAPATYEAGPHTALLRVTDDIGRTGDEIQLLEIPSPQSGGPTIAPPTDTGNPKTDPGSTGFTNVNIKVKAATAMKLAVLKIRGLAVTVSGVSDGDIIRATLGIGKKKIVGRGSGRSTGSKKTVRIKLTKAGKRALSAKKKPKTLRIAVTVTGSDGFSQSKARNIKLKR